MLIGRSVPVPRSMFSLPSFCTYSMLNRFGSPDIASIQCFPLEVFGSSVVFLHKDFVSLSIRETRVGNRKKRLLVSHLVRA